MDKIIFAYILFLLVLSACPKKEVETNIQKVIVCENQCPSGYVCDEIENRCLPLPHSFSCADSCPSDKYCSSSGECKPNPVFCQMGQIPTRCSSNTDCYAGQMCINSYCFYPLCKCSSNENCDAINQICNEGVCDCYDIGCKSDEECTDDQVCIRHYPICGQCVPKSK